jgi:hypothetical protein
MEVAEIISQSISKEEAALAFSQKVMLYSPMVIRPKMGY